MNQTLQSICDSRRLNDALNLILSRPIRSDHSLYSKVLQLCIDSRAEKQGRVFHNHLSDNGFQSNLHFDTKLIIFYAKIGDLGNAHDVFDKMPYRSVVSWTALLSGYSQNGDSNRALMVFSQMHRVGVKANQFTYGSALRACTSLSCVDVGKQVQASAQKSRFIEDLFVQSALMDLHSKCGKMEDACYIFRGMAVRDLVCWNTMIGGFAVQGFSKDVCQMFRAMLNEGIVPCNAQ